MPYPFAHPAALLPLVPLMGRHAVPSALVIGSMVPDLGQVLPFGSRDLSHSGAGLLFCLPAGLVAYLLFHLLLKNACIALLPPTLAGRVRGFAARGLPAVPWHAVLASLVAGALTHLVWDGLTRGHGAPTHSINWLQHASTLFGTLLLAWWLWRKLRSAPVSPPHEREISPTARAWVWALLLTVTAASAGWSAYDWPATHFDVATLRKIARTAASAALQGFTVAALLCCAAWKLR